MSDMRRRQFIALIVPQHSGLTFTPSKIRQRLAGSRPQALAPIARRQLQADLQRSAFDAGADVHALRKKPKTRPPTEAATRKAPPKQPKVGIS